MSSTSKKVGTPVEMAHFYLSPIEGNPKRFWWQTMDRGRMAAIFRETLLYSGVIIEGYRPAILKVLETLEKSEK